MPTEARIFERFIQFSIMIENAKRSSKIVQRRKFRNRTVFDLKSTHVALSTEFIDVS